MTSIRSTRHLWLVTAFVVLSVGWFAAPQASQDDANDQFLLFTSDRAFPNDAGICGSCEDIYVMRPDGELPGLPNATRLTFGGGVVAASYNSGGADWSRTKRLIAFQSNRPTDPSRPLERIPQIYLMNPDGSGPRLLVNLPRGGAFPSLSHTGNELCFHSQTMPRRDIYAVNIDGTGLVNLTSATQLPGQTGTAGDNIRCDWSPKASTIAFSSNRLDPPGTLPADRNDEIYVINADGSGLRRLTGGPLQDEAPGSDVNPAWSPKGDKIAFESNRTGMPEIWVMNADGSNQVRLTNFENDITPNNVNVTKPTWSPKGDRIAFHRRVSAVQGERGHLQVYTMNADGSDVRQITFTETPGSSGFPSWGKWGSEF